MAAAAASSSLPTAHFEGFSADICRSDGLVGADLVLFNGVDLENMGTAEKGIVDPLNVWIMSCGKYLGNLMRNRKGFREVRPFVYQRIGKLVGIL